MFISKLVYASSLSSVSSPYDRTWTVTSHKVDEVVDEESETLIDEVSRLINTNNTTPAQVVKTKDLTRMWCNCANTYWLVLYCDLVQKPETTPQMELTPTFTQLCERYKIASESTGDFHWLLLGSAEAPPN